jgi:LysM repeat protein
MFVMKAGLGRWTSISSRSIKVLSVAAVGSLVGLSACGNSGGSSSETTPSPNTTPWRTLAPVAAETETTLALETGSITYTIRSGDYANLIANKAGGDCTGPELLDYNPEVEVLIPGRTLQIPASCLGDGVTQESINAVEEETDSTDEESDTTDKDDEEYNAYTVKTGQSWGGISKRTGCSITELKNANRGERLNPGDVLRVPQSCDERDDPDSFSE